MVNSARNKRGVGGALGHLATSLVGTQVKYSRHGKLCSSGFVENNDTTVVHNVTYMQQRVKIGTPLGPENGLFINFKWS